MLSAPRRRSPLLALLALLAAGCATPAPDAGLAECRPRPATEQACLLAVPAAPAPLAAGGTATARIDARCPWNRTGVRLEPGARYALAVTRALEPWVDWWVPSHPRTGWTGIAGWFNGLANGRARAANAPMYALVGAQGQRPDTFFVAGEASTLRATHAEELLLFANDWPARYGNNHGCLELTIRRID